MNLQTGLAILTAVVHVLAAAAWFGAMFYSLSLIQPRLREQIDTESEYEGLVAAIARGARWKVLSGLILIALTGFILTILNWPEPVSVPWIALIAVKMLLTVVAIGIFVHVSWRLWPTRIFASESELPNIRRQFHRAGLTLLTIAGFAIVLGIIAHYLR